MSPIMNPRSFIRPNSGCKISSNDRSLITVPANDLMLFEELVMMVVQLVTGQNLSLVLTTSLSLMYFM